VHSHSLYLQELLLPVVELDLIDELSEKMGAIYLSK
jgi:hypothetical protein